MAIVINGSGTVTGLAVGGLPDGTVDAGTVAADVATQAEIDAKLNLAGGTMTGVLNMGTADTVSTNNKIIFGKAVTASQSYLPVIQQGSPDGAGVDLILATTSGTGAVRVFTGNSGTSGVPFANSNTEKLSILSDGRGLSQFTAKAWTNFNGTGTAALVDSHNVSSLTDSGTGHYVVNIANVLGNISSACFGNASASRNSGSDNRLACCTVTSTSTIDTRVGNASAGSYVDAELVTVLVFGD